MSDTASHAGAPAAAVPVSNRIEVRHSAIHGHGVFATRPLAAGHRIGHYAGRRYSAAQAARRHWDHELTYVFGLSDGSLIDGSVGGNATRHLNHSCQPNCAAYEVRDARGRLQVELQALRRIGVGEELFIDYGLAVELGAPADFPCHCGARHCRGTLLAAAA